MDGISSVSPRALTIHFDFKCGYRRCAAGQRIVAAVVQSANSVAVEDLRVDFQARLRKKLGRELLDCETDGIRGAGKSPVADESPPELSSRVGNDSASLLVGNNWATVP
jgi:hypothetical protein